MPVFPMVSVPFETEAEPLEIKSYDIDEMLGTKMRALFQRDQSRDLFDRDRALTTPSSTHVANPERIVFAFSKYMARRTSR